MELNEIYEDPYYKRFVKPSWSYTSVNRCRGAFRAYYEFYLQEKGLEITPKNLLERLQEDRKKPILDQGKIEREWLEFVEWLKTKYNKRQFKDTKVSSATVRDYANVVKQFYKDFGLPLASLAKLPKSIRSDKGKVENKKINVRAKDVKQLLNVMRTNKDKAITMLLFQTGIDLSSVFSLKYCDIMKEFEEGTEPIVVHVQRGKSSVAHRTCIGRDGITALKVYLNEVRERRWRCERCGASWRVRRNTCPWCNKQGFNHHNMKEYREELSPDSYLFVSKETAINSEISNFEQRFRQYGILAGLITEDQLKRADINPARPYALRSAFRSVLGFKNMDRDLIEYMMGHSDSYNGAYLNFSDDELRDIYKQYEEHLSVSEVKELADVRMDFEKKLGHVTDSLTKRIDELEAMMKNRAEMIAGSESKLDVQTVLQVIETIESNPRLLRELMNGMAKNKGGEKK